MQKYFKYKIKCLPRETLNYVAREEEQRPATQLATFSLPVFKHKINIMVLLTFCKKASLHNAADIYFEDKEGTSSGKPCILAQQGTGFIIAGEQGECEARAGRDSSLSNQRA